MASIQVETLSSFGRLAVKLDAAFSELTRLSGQIDRLDIESDGGLDRALKLLAQFGERGQEMADGIQNFSKALQDAHAQSEAAARQVAQRAEQIRLRKVRENEIREKFMQVENAVRATNETLAGFRKEGNGAVRPDENARARTALEAVGVELKRLVSDAQAVRDEAAEAKFKSLEREARALLDALRASSRKVEKAVGGHEPAA